MAIRGTNRTVGSRLGSGFGLAGDPRGRSLTPSRGQPVPGNTTLDLPNAPLPGGDETHPADQVDISRFDRRQRFGGVVGFDADLLDLSD